ncbi:hypothetical protein DCO58_00210 [Helicobacter saguini]|uniref:hypothetical protein n=1 Tax=Helicobacter saguini TaxID=1548018 RepID=UPI001320874D|nr:hypothetical protein [Helicobacter saguini]MWV63184.1 hypothetical protein [Helicobacter saguini]MWV66146.1 hypothetical protein [Helicobacter saguini]MWV71950.1 hypothetical protein [Helicobacter saguini]
MVNPHTTTGLNAKDRQETSGQTKCYFLTKKTLANISFIASLMIAGGGVILS